jgi:hypothetical protein
MNDDRNQDHLQNHQSARKEPDGHLRSIHQPSASKNASGCRPAPTQCHRVIERSTGSAQIAFRKSYRHVSGPVANDPED